MSVEALKLAFEAHHKNERHNSVAETNYWCNQYKLLAHQAIEALAKQEQDESMRPEIRKMYEDYFDKCFAMFAKDHEKVFDQIQQEQGEPVAWYVDFGNEHEPNYFVFGAKPDDEPTATVRPLVFGDTTPQQRTWVGLMDDERYEIANVPRWSSGAFVEATEAKLKEKNT